MGILDKLRTRTKEKRAPEAVAPAMCPHTALVPRWDQPGDIGKPEKVTLFVCDACGRSFPREEGERISAEQVQRLRAEAEQLKR